MIEDRPYVEEKQVNLKKISILVFIMLIAGFLVFSFFGKKDNQQDKIVPIPITSMTPEPLENKAVLMQQKHSLNEEDIRSIIKKYVDENPSAIIKSIESYYMAKANEAKASQKNIIMNQKDEIYNNLHDPKIGNLNATVKVVEFFDYACSFCKKMLKTHQRILSEYPDIQIIFKELPVMSDWSSIASKAALAVNMIDSSKYYAFHDKLFDLEDRSEDGIMKVAFEIGIDTAALKSMMQQPTIDEMLIRNNKLASDLKITGTPIYIINDIMMPGAQTYSEMKAAVEAAGAKKSLNNPDITAITTASQLENTTIKAPPSIPQPTAEEARMEESIPQLQTMDVKDPIPNPVSAQTPSN